MLRPSLLIFLFTGWPGRSSIARIERAHSYRARSASRRTTRLPRPFFRGLPLEDFSIVLRMHPRLIGKTERGAIGIACIIEINSIVPADRFHGDFKGNGLRIQVAWCV